MALWDSADLLRRCKNLARRPATDQGVPDLMWYDFLTEAQQEVYADIFPRFPDFGYSAPIKLTSADGNYTYTFGLDAAGDPIRPTGHAEIYPTDKAIPDAPLVPGADFIFESGLIRFPGMRPRAFPNGPWARFVADPDIAISAALQPLLQPKKARMLLVYKALEHAAMRPGNGDDPDKRRAAYDSYLTKMIMSLRTSYNRQGTQAAGAVNEMIWWYSGNLGQSGLNL